MDRERQRGYEEAYRRKHSDRRRASGRKYYLKNKERITARNKKWTLKNKHRKRGYRLKHRYGITEAQYLALVAAQEGRCAICRKERKLHVDHDHATGKNRKLLCYQCNTMLGLSGENAQTLRLAAEYLEGFSNELA